MRLQPIVDELKARGCARVYGALEFAGLKAAPTWLSFYVVPEVEEAQANSLVDQPGASDQLVLDRFMVVIAMPAATANEAGISDALEDEKIRVRDALAGWTHPAASRACEYAGGALLSADGQVLAWAVRFRSGSRLRKVG